MRKFSLFVCAAFLAFLAPNVNAGTVLTFAGVSGTSGSASETVLGGTVNYTWSGDSDAGQFGGAAGGFDNFIATAGGTGIVSFTFTPDPGFSAGNWVVASQLTNTGAGAIPQGSEFGELTTDGIFDVTTQLNLSSLAGDGTSLLTYGDSSANNRGSFVAEFSGTTFSYEFSTVGPTNGNGLRDPFTLEVSGVAATVPEPSAIALLAFSGLGLLVRRKRS